MLKNYFVMAPWIEHKPLSGIHISKVAKIKLRILNICIAHSQVRLTYSYMWKKCVKSSIRTDSLRLTVFVTFQTHRKVHADIF
jgi:hypothetical protein